MMPDAKDKQKIIRDAAKSRMAKEHAKVTNPNDPWAPTPKTEAEKKPSTVQTRTYPTDQKPGGRRGSKYKVPFGSEMEHRYFEKANKERSVAKGGLDAANAGFMPPIHGAKEGGYVKEYRTNHPGGVAYDESTKKDKQSTLSKVLFGNKKYH
jgi:hypothetical protein